MKNIRYPSCWVNASAGSGKTKILIDRLLMLLVCGEPFSSILCLTYTNAAAKEMKERLQSKLKALADMDFAERKIALTNLLERQPSFEELEQAQNLYAQFAQHYAELHIETIHRFCLDIIQTFPLDIGFLGDIHIIDALTAHEAVQRMIEKYLFQEIGQSHKSNVYEAITTLWTMFSPEKIESMLLDLLNRKYELAQILEDRKSNDKFLQSLRISIKSPFDEKQIQKIVNLVDFANLSEKDQTFFQDLQNQQYTKAFLTTSETLRKQLVSNSLKKNEPEIVAVLEQQGQVWFETLQQKQIDSLIQGTQAFLTLCESLLDDYALYKKEHGLCDFEDLISLTENFLNSKLNDPDMRSAILNQFPIHHIFVDEAQDTSPQQWSLILKWVKNVPNTAVFIVGDVKQSIYSFQGAKPELFCSLKSKFKNHIQKNGGQWQEKSLTKSYRTAPAILAAVDKIFLHDGTGVAFNQQPYSPHSSNRAEQGWIRWIQVEESDKSDNKLNTESSDLAQTTVQTIQELLEKSIYLPSVKRTLQPDDILILTRKRNENVQNVISILKENHIPVAGADRIPLSKHMIWLDLLAFVRFLIFPDDDYTVACLFKSPFVQQSSPDQTLFDLCYDRKSPLFRNTFFEKSKLNLYRREFLKNTSSSNFINFFIRVLNDVRPHYLCEFGSFTDVVFETFIQEISVFLQSHGPDFFTLNHYLGKLDLRVKTPFIQKGVRFMTVHGSKGLQAPVVFILDQPERNPLQKQEFAWPTENEKSYFCLMPPLKLATSEMLRIRNQAACALHAENRRLLYVAMTRAQDGLCIIGQKDGWFELATQALQPFEGKYEYKLNSEKHLFINNSNISELTRPQGTFNSKIKKTQTQLLSQQEHGICVHMLLNLMVEKIQHNPDISDLDLLSFLQSCPHENLNDNDLALLLKIRSLPEFVWLQRGKSEVSFCDHEKTYRLDYLYLDTATAIIVEVKTSTHPIPQVYQNQIQQYQSLVKSTWSDKLIQTYFLWMHVPVFQKIDF